MDSDKENREEGEIKFTPSELVGALAAPQLTRLASQLVEERKKTQNSRPRAQKEPKVRPVALREPDGESLGEDEDEYIAKKRKRGEALQESTEEEMASEQSEEVYAPADEEELELSRIYMELGKVKFIIKRWLDRHDSLDTY